MKTHISHFHFPGSSQAIFRVNFDGSTLQAEDLLWLPHHARLSGAVTKRQAEHLAGRLAAHAALQAQGIEIIPGIGLSRAPCWPVGFTGSITHTDNLAMATVIASIGDEICGTGIDTETILSEKTAEETASLILTPAELQRLHTPELPFPLLVTLHFSAKESLFKALFHHVGHYFGFSAAEVIKINSHQLELKLTQTLGPFCAGQCFETHWQYEENYLTTLVTFSFPERN